MVQGMGLGNNNKEPKPKPKVEETTSRKSTQQSRQAKPSKQPKSTKQRKPKKQPKAPKPKKSKESSANGKGKFVLIFVAFVILLLGLGIFFMKNMGDTADNDTVVEDPAEDVAIVAENPKDAEMIQLLASDHILHNPFSKKGLSEQLISEGYDPDVAVDVIGEMDVDWNEIAKDAAVRYVQYMGAEASVEGLDAQLTYEGFTEGEIKYAVENTDIETLIQEVESESADESEGE